MLETGSRLHNFKHTSMSNQKCIKIPETDSQRHARDTGGMSRRTDVLLPPVATITNGGKGDIASRGIRNARTISAVTTLAREEEITWEGIGA